VSRDAQVERTPPATGSPSRPGGDEVEPGPTAAGSGVDPDVGAGLRISDAAAQAGVSARTLRYYEELGLLTPSGYTSGGERRYRQPDLTQLDRILELREVLGMNLDEIKTFLDSEIRLDEVRQAYRAKKGVGTSAAKAQQKALLEEALRLNESLAEQVGAKLTRMDDFRSRLVANAQRCRELITELSH
jgi:MerR family transcriptional regulator, repressor of the yfmOP operon